MYGHMGAIHAIVALVIATAFLVWVAGKEGNPYKKFGVVIGWIAVILSALIVVGSVTTCVTHCKKGGWPCMRGGMMEGGGMPMMPMGPMGMPPPAPPAGK